MNELTPRQILDAIDHALDEVSRRFAAKASKSSPRSGGSALAGKSNNGKHEMTRSKPEIGKASL